jgi:hypothetical protein
MAYGTNKKKPTLRKALSNRPVELNPYNKNNYGVPKGTTSGKDAAGREVYYAPGSAPRYSAKSKSYSVGQAEGPTSMSKKDIKKLPKIARLEKKFDKLTLKREVAKSNPEKRNKITRIAKKENRLMAKHTKIVNK